VRFENFTLEGSFSPGADRHSTLSRPARVLLATWRSGYAAACKAVYAGSIPAVASSADRAALVPCRDRRHAEDSAGLGQLRVLMTARLGEFFREWRSLVALPAGGRAVAGSNPVSRTDEGIWDLHRFLMPPCGFIRSRQTIGRSLGLYDLGVWRSLVSALRSDRRGRWFESSYPDLRSRADALELTIIRLTSWAFSSAG
jgi:hypothetical protein